MPDLWNNLDCFGDPQISFANTVAVILITMNFVRDYPVFLIKLVCTFKSDHKTKRVKSLYRGGHTSDWSIICRAFYSKC